MEVMVVAGKKTFLLVFDLRHRDSRLQLLPEAS
jgi:hypothetical protein